MTKPGNLRRRMFSAFLRGAGIAEGSRLPNWALALRAIVFPIVGLRILLSRHYIPGAEFDPLTDSVKFVGRDGVMTWSMALLSGDYNAAGLYRFTWDRDLKIWVVRRCRHYEDIESLVKSEIEAELLSHSREALAEIRKSLSE